MAYESRRSKSAAPYQVGKKIYGGGRSYPTAGPVGDKLGYAKRDAEYRARRQAILRRLQAKQGGKHMSADALRKV